MAARVAAIVAARNEEGRVGAVVRALRSEVGVAEVLVVAGGSTDGTAREALEAGARVLVGEGRSGKGQAVEAALAALPAEVEVVVLVDGDVGETAREVDALLDEVLAGRADLAVGRFPPAGGAGGFGLVKRFAAGCIRRAVGLEVEEPLSGQRAAWRAVLEACRPLAAGFGLETAMTVDAARLGYRVVEVPVAMSHRPTGRSLAGFAHRAGQGLDIARAVAPRLIGLR
jgi:glycosyltransferase involved in cell wall biosynthesis